MNTTSHRVSAADVFLAERVRIVNGSVTKVTNLCRCRLCGRSVILRSGQSRDVWVHGTPEGIVEAK